VDKEEPDLGTAGQSAVGPGSSRHKLLKIEERLSVHGSKGN
jgi:hypothetical protein